MQMLGIDIFRFIIGLWGSIVVIKIICIVYKKIPHLISGKIALLGENSLGIYIISGFIFPVVLAPICAGMEGINYVTLLLETVLICGGTFLCTVAIKKIRIAKYLLLGGR